MDTWKCMRFATTIPPHDAHPRRGSTRNENVQYRKPKAGSEVTYCSSVYDHVLAPHGGRMEGIGALALNKTTGAENEYVWGAKFLLTIRRDLKAGPSKSLHRYSRRIEKIDAAIHSTVQFRTIHSTRN